MQQVQTLIKKLASLLKRALGTRTGDSRGHSEVPSEMVKSWRQGMVFRAGIVPRDQSGPSVDPDDRLVIISHDCDVSSLDFEKEPYVEVLLARPAQPNGSLSYGKNPRRIQFSTSSSGGDMTLYESSIHERFRIERTLLIGAISSGVESVEPGELVALRRWVAKRYERAAFPDSFNDRVEPVANSIRQALKKEGGTLISGIYVGLHTDDELGPDDAYRVQIVATMTVTHFTDAELRAPAQQAFDKVLERFNSCKGIEIEDDSLRSEANISLDDVRTNLRRWDYDDLSHRKREAEFPVVDR